MLQTRLFPYFIGEGRRLTFAAAPIYLRLIQFCVVGGGVLALLDFLAPMVGVPLPFFPGWAMMTGVMVAAAGVLAAYSLRFISFDLKERMYRRRDGTAVFNRTSKGKITILDAVVVSSHRSLSAGVLTGGVALEYRLTLHWKNAAEAPMLLALDHRSLPIGAYPQQGAASMLQLGQRVAKALELPLYDNSHTLQP